MSSGLLESRNDVSWGDGGGFLGRMGFAWRFSCGGAGEGVPWHLSGCPGKSLPDATDQEGAVEAGSCLIMHSIQSALVRGELLNAFKKLCSLHLAATGIKRREDIYSLVHELSK